MAGESTRLKWLQGKLMAHNMITPLQPEKFFTGIWQGEGELSPHPLFRWVMPKDHIRFLSQPIWLSDKIWVVKERFEFSTGDVIARTMFVEIVGPKRLHVTADDMPLGADIILHQKGFRFTPYYTWSYYKGIRWRLRCIDENLIDENGTIHDTIKMFFFGFPVAIMRLTVTVDRT